jgi:hypothetical protein
MGMAPPGGPPGGPGHEGSITMGGRGPMGRGPAAQGPAAQPAQRRAVLQSARHVGAWHATLSLRRPQAADAQQTAARPTTHLAACPSGAPCPGGTRAACPGRPPCPRAAGGRAASGACLQGKLMPAMSASERISWQAGAVRRSGTPAAPSRAFALHPGSDRKPPAPAHSLRLLPSPSPAASQLPSRALTSVLHALRHRQHLAHAPVLLLPRAQLHHTVLQLLGQLGVLLAGSLHLRAAWQARGAGLQGCRAAGLRSIGKVWRCAVAGRVPIWARRRRAVLWTAWARSPGAVTRAVVAAAATAAPAASHLALQVHQHVAVLQLAQLLQLGVVLLQLLQLVAVPARAGNGSCVSHGAAPAATGRQLVTRAQAAAPALAAHLLRSAFWCGLPGLLPS